MRKCLEELTYRDGVSVEDDVEDDLASIMKDMTAEVRRSFSEGSVQRIFWEQQLKALKTKESCQLRWHPAVIRWCLHIRFKSPGAYESLRNSGVLTLPSERKRLDYSHWSKSCPGFSAALNEELLREVDMRQDINKFIVLAFDEMKIKENLVLDKHSSLICFIDLGIVNDTLEDLEKQCNRANDETTPRVATHVLSFMVRGIFSSLCFPYAHFPTKGITAEELFPLVWEAVFNLEAAGFRVMVLTCDGAACNRKFFKMNGVSRGKDELVYKTRNPHAEDGRSIYFMSDVPHLMKTTRNCWSNSFSHSHSKALWVRLCNYSCQTYDLN